MDLYSNIASCANSSAKCQQSPHLSYWDLDFPWLILDGFARIKILYFINNIIYEILNVSFVCSELQTYRHSAANRTKTLGMPLKPEGGPDKLGLNPINHDNFFKWHSPHEQNLPCFLSLNMCTIILRERVFLLFHEIAFCKCITSH